MTPYLFRRYGAMEPPAGGRSKAWVIAPAPRVRGEGRGGGPYLIRKFASLVSCTLLSPRHDTRIRAASVGGPVTVHSYPPSTSVEPAAVSTIVDQVVPPSRLISIR